MEFKVCKSVAVDVQGSWAFRILEELLWQRTDVTRTLQQVEVAVILHTGELCWKQTMVLSARRVPGALNSPEGNQRA